MERTNHAQNCGRHCRQRTRRGCAGGSTLAATHTSYGATGTGHRATVAWLWPTGQPSSRTERTQHAYSP